jgi:hypothetical protein
MKNLISNSLASSLYKIILFLGGNEMVTVYVTLIIKGYRTYESVPENLQPAVAEELEQLGLGLDGKPLPVEEPQV